MLDILIEKLCSTCVNIMFYVMCFSEENVWKLCEKIRDEQAEDLSEYFAVFISNAARQVCGNFMAILVLSLLTCLLVFFKSPIEAHLLKI